MYAVRFFNFMAFLYQCIARLPLFSVDTNAKFLPDFSTSRPKNSEIGSRPHSEHVGGFCRPHSQHVGGFCRPQSQHVDVFCARARCCQHGVYLSDPVLFPPSSCISWLSFFQFIDMKFCRGGFILSAHFCDRLRPDQRGNYFSAPRFS